MILSRDRVRRGAGLRSGIPEQFWNSRAILEFQKVSGRFLESCLEIFSTPRDALGVTAAAKSKRDIVSVDGSKFCPCRLFQSGFSARYILLEDPLESGILWNSRRILWNLIESIFCELEPDFCLAKRFTGIRDGLSGCDSAARLLRRWRLWGAYAVYRLLALYAENVISAMPIIELDVS